MSEPGILETRSTGPAPAPAQKLPSSRPSADVEGLSAAAAARANDSKQTQSLTYSVPSKQTILGMYHNDNCPLDEVQRLRTVALLSILDQPEDPVLLSITKLATKLLAVPAVGKTSIVAKLASFVTPQ